MIFLIDSGENQDAVNRPVSDDAKIAAAAPFGGDTRDESCVYGSVFEGSVDIARVVSLIPNRLLCLCMGQCALQKELKRQEIEIVDRAENHTTAF